MTRTIYILFPESGSFYPTAKRYTFLCNYDCVRKGDTIRDPGYTSPMLVVDITSCTGRVQNRMTLKDIYITHINNRLLIQPSGLVNGVRIGNDFDIDKQRVHNMEKRNIKVTLEQATEWYNSDNETLRTLALTAYTEEELTLNRDYIFNKVKGLTATLIPSVDDKKFLALADLTVIAKHFNGSWKKTPSNTGYFLGQSNLKFSNSRNLDDIKGLRNIGICEHNTVMYPGIVYFKNPEDIIKAVKIMGDKIKDLF